MQEILAKVGPTDGSPTNPGDPPGRLLRVIGVQLLLPALGVLGGWWCLLTVLLPGLGFGDLDRIVQMGQHLQQTRPKGPYLCAVGSSIVQDGFDSEVVRESLDTSCIVENIADPGAKLWDHLSKLPLILKAKPSAVLFGIGPSDYYDRVVAGDKRYAMSVAGFSDAWSPEYSQDLPRELAQRQSAVDAMPSWQKWLHFRVVPVVWINKNFRLLARGDDLRAAPSDWIAPHVYERPITPQQLEVHLAHVRRTWTKGAGEAMDNASEFRQLARYTKEAGATPVFLFYPIHPALRDVAAPLEAQVKAQAEAVAAEYGGLVVDASRLLPAEDFNDAFHPGALGREKWSRFIGETLAAHGLPRPGDSQRDH